MSQNPSVRTIRESLLATNRATSVDPIAIDGLVVVPLPLLSKITVLLTSSWRLGLVVPTPKRPEESIVSLLALALMS